MEPQNQPVPLPPQPVLPPPVAPVPSPVPPPPTAPVPGPVSPPPVVPPGGVVPPAVGAPPPLPPQPAPKKSKAGLIVGIVIGVVVVFGALAYWGLSVASQQAKNFSESVNSSSSNSKLVDSQSTNPCAAKLGDEKPSGKRFIEQADISEGLDLHNTGDADSTLEFCEAKDMKTAAEKFLNTLGAHDWNQAYTLITTEAKATPLATKVDNWSGEYGRWPTFSMSGLKKSASTEHASYGLEMCRNDYSAGWAKDINVGFYKTPSFELSSEGKVTTVITIILKKENGSWLVNGENNWEHNASGIVSGDAYSHDQNARQLNPYTCS